MPTNRLRVQLCLPLWLLLAACGSDHGSTASSTNTVEAEAAVVGSDSGGDAAAESELIRLEQDYARALMAKDRNFLERFYASDWRGGNWMGFWTKPTMLDAVMSERYAIKQMKLRDLSVRVIGDVGIVQGVDEETTSVDGRDTSGRWAFTDVFARRDGRWVAVASHTSEVRATEP